MLTKELLQPKSIVVVGGSADTGKPGGSVIKNLIAQGYKGKLYVVNPKAEEVQGVKCHASVDMLPDVDLAMLAIPAAACVEAVEVLARKKNTKGFIIFSAGFHEESAAGAELEEKIVKIVNETGGSLIGPNCIGVMNTCYAGVFTGTIPPLSDTGVDFITGSGATAVFLMQAAMRFGLPFAGVYSIGNSAQIGVEDVLEHLDETYVHGKSAPVKMLYIESVNKPAKLLKHAQSLIRKGARITAVKSGSSEAGSRAASSHTGALASPDVAVSALFKKAGIIRCYGRTELALMAAVLLQPLPTGKNMAVVTHAGGPAVMLTDALSNGGMEVPHIEGPKAEALLAKLFAGSSAGNPIDFLATGTAEQLGYILDACENDFDGVDGVAVIFGSPGLFPIYDVYELLAEKIKTARKPIFPIFPSYGWVKGEVDEFVRRGGCYFPDEVLFGQALARVCQSKRVGDAAPEMPEIDVAAVRQVVDSAANGYLDPAQIHALLDAAGIARAREGVARSVEQAMEKAGLIGFPLVMKVVGPVHKSDVGGVVLNVRDQETVRREFERMMKIPETYAVMLAQQLAGTEVFIGAKREGEFGHIVMCGLGGIFIEVLKDVASGLAPLSPEDAREMIGGLRSYKIIQGVRGQEPVNEARFAEMVSRVSELTRVAPEIFEMDLNPLLGNAHDVVAVDARIRIEKRVLAQSDY